MSTTIATEAKVQKFALKDLEPAPYNPRQITPEAMAGLRESLASLGVLEMPVVNVHDGGKRIVGGHQRVKALLAEGKTHADCVVVDFDPMQEMAANIALNNPAIRGDFDVRAAVPTLDAILKAAPSPNYAGLGALSTEMHELAERLGPLVPPSAAADTSPDVDAKPDSKLGTVYVLGRHRLLCGDVANDKDLGKLFGKKKTAAACITDPPYGVAYEQDSTGDTLQNDDLQGEAWTKFLAYACSAIIARTSGPCFVFMSSKEIPALDAAWKDAGGVLHRWLFWAKDRFTLGRGDYHHMHEPCLFGSREGVDAPIEGALTNVLEFPKPQTNDLHPTQKPVELIRQLVLASTESGEIVFDPFSGSGTTLAVCEEQGRTCYAVEIEPKHCDTIRRRWAEQVHGQGCDWKALTEPAKKAT